MSVMDLDGHHQQRLPGAGLDRGGVETLKLPSTASVCLIVRPRRWFDNRGARLKMATISSQKQSAAVFEGGNEKRPRAVVDTCLKSLETPHW